MLHAEIWVRHLVSCCLPPEAVRKKIFTPL
jgi:hypothetical protein